MWIQRAYDLGAFGVPSKQLWDFIQTLPFDVLQQSFIVWSKQKVESLKSVIQESQDMIDSISLGLEEKAPEVAQPEYIEPTDTVEIPLP